MRKHIVAGNWKMNKTFEEADELISNIMDKLEEVELDRNTQVIICPPAASVNRKNARKKKWPPIRKR